MMVVAGRGGVVVDGWQVVGWLGLKGGCVGFVHGGEIEVERCVGFWIKYFIGQIYYFNVLYRKIKDGMLGVLKNGMV